MEIIEKKKTIINELTTGVQQQARSSRRKDEQTQRHVIGSYSDRRKINDKDWRKPKGLMRYHQGPIYTIMGVSEGEEREK